jgi:hypothetical protein
MSDFIKLANELADHLHRMRVSYVVADDPQVARHATWIRELAEQLGAESAAPTRRRIEGFNECVRRKAERDHPDWKVCSITLNSELIGMLVSGARTRIVFEVELGKVEDWAQWRLTYELGDDDVLRDLESELGVGQ